jgi:hypothetical protein
MRTKHKRLFLFVIAIFFVNALNAANFFTNLTADWNSMGLAWGENITWTTIAPNPLTLNQDKIFIGRDDGVNSPAHHVVLNGELIGKNGVEIYIYKNSTLEIKGDLTAQNKFVINVYDGAKFIVTGNVTINSGDGTAGDLTINGEADVTGSISGNGTITGSGSLTVSGTIDNSILINPDNESSVNVVGNGATYCPPTNLKADVKFSENKYIVTLNWEYIIECGALRFEIKRTLGNSIFIDSIGITKSTTFTWEDTDPSLKTESNPIYEVQAVYSNDIKSTPVVYSFVDDPLPIELMFFTAETSNKGVNLNWATATEINNDFFTIERSLNGNNWEVIDYLTGAGNANYMIEYSFTDANPYQGVSYYRLKQTDYDGKFEYFAPVAVNMTKSAGMSEIINVTFNSSSMEVWFQNEQQNSILLVADIQGRIIAQHTLNSEDFVQNVKVNFPRNYNGEVVMVRLVSSEKSHERKYMVR